MNDWTWEFWLRSWRTDSLSTDDWWSYSLNWWTLRKKQVLGAGNQISNLNTFSLTYLLDILVSGFHGRHSLGWESFAHWYYQIHDTGWDDQEVNIEREKKKVGNWASDSPVLRGWKEDWGSLIPSNCSLSNAAAFSRDGSRPFDFHLRIFIWGQEKTTQVETTESGRKWFSNIMISLSCSFYS